MLGLLAGSLVFVAAGVWTFSRSPLGSGACVVFFGLCAAVASISMHPRASYLTLTEQGFEFASLFRRHFTGWRAVAQFVPYTHVHNDFVGWNYAPGNDQKMSLRRMNVALTGVEAALPDTYGHSNVHLAALMNALLAQHGGAGVRVS